VASPCELYFLGFTHFKSKQYFSYPRHYHPAYELLIPLSENYHCKLNGSNISVKCGEILLVQEGDWHEDILEPEDEFVVFTFSVNPPGNGHLDYTRAGASKIRRKLFADGIKPEEQKTIYGDNTFVTTILKQISAMPDSSEIQQNIFYVMDGLFRALFWHLIFFFPERQLSNAFLRYLSDDESLRSLIEVFSRHAFSKLNLDRIAAEMNMSRSSLTHKFKSILGESVAAAFMRYKLSRTESPLKDSKLSINEISDMFGFENQFHFSRVFKRFYGISPLQYRKKH
jgi:AraC-like DNA-binding protein